MKRIGLALAAFPLFAAHAIAGGPAPAERLSFSPDAPAPTIRIADNASEFEATMWNIVRKSDNPADYEAYLEVFPNGQFAEKARGALARLRAAKPKAMPKASRSIRLAPEEKLEGIGRTYVVRATANLRAAPGTDSQIVGRAAKGDTIFVLGRIVGRDWYKVSNKAGLVAYIAAFLVGEPQIGAPAPAPKAAAPPSTPAPPPQRDEPDTPAAPTPAATPAPARKSPDEIRAYWTRKIDAVKDAGPHGSCGFVVGDKWEDPAEYDICEANNAKIKALQQEMERALADR